MTQLAVNAGVRTVMTRERSCSIRKILAVSMHSCRMSEKWLQILLIRCMTVLIHCLAAISLLHRSTVPTCENRDIAKNSAPNEIFVNPNQTLNDLSRTSVSLWLALLIYPSLLGMSIPMLYQVRTLTNCTMMKSTKVS
jgi:hypothetical protein